MKIVVVGYGKIGHALVQQLANEGHDIVVIDKKERVLNDSQEEFDIGIVNGNGAVVEIQREAGVAKADLLIAVSSSDEINLLSCTVAKMLGCKRTIARVRNPEYDQNIDFLRGKLSLARAINPEKETAREISRLLQYPQFTQRNSFANGRVELVQFRLNKNSYLAGRSLENISSDWNNKVLVCAVEREGEVTIPSGSFKLEMGDKITIAVDSKRRSDVLHNLLSASYINISKVMIVGGSRIAMYLASRLTADNIAVTLIENDHKRCEYLSEVLPKSTIINGDGTSQTLLLEEGIKNNDAIVTLTGIDEENIIISIFANSIGIKKTITKINRVEYTNVLSTVGIDTIVSPKDLTANQIVCYVRAMDNKIYNDENSEGTVETLYKIIDGKAEGLGFTVSSEANYTGIPLSKLSVKCNILIASIIRKNKVIIPKGSDHLEVGDSVVIVNAAVNKVSNLKEIFNKK